MNTPPESFVLVQEDDLLAFATACFEKVGLDHDHAALISRFLVNSDLRGVRSHGTRAMNGYTQSFVEGNLNPAPNVELVHETPTAAVLDGDGALGYLPMVQATEHDRIMIIVSLGKNYALARDISKSIQQTKQMGYCLLQGFGGVILGLMAQCLYPLLCVWHLL